MKKYTEFPYPKKDKITVYGREGCPYCEKIKSFLKDFYGKNLNKNVDYHDIFDIIDSKQAKDVTDFKKKMKIYIDDWSTVPMVFDNGNFVGGYDDYCTLLYDILIYSVDKKGLNMTMSEAKRRFPLIKDKIEKFQKDNRGLGEKINKCGQLKKITNSYKKNLK